MAGGLSSGTVYGSIYIHFSCLHLRAVQTKIATYPFGRIVTRLQVRNRMKRDVNET
jgi:hypothetical protein